MPRLAATLALAALIGTLTACTTALPPPTQQCKTAVFEADTYALWVRNETTYPNDTMAEGDAINTREQSLLAAMVKACPPDTEVTTLPSS